MGYWNAILDPSIDRGQGASGKSLGECSFADLISEFGLVDRYLVDILG